MTPPPDVRRAAFSLFACLTRALSNAYLRALLPPLREVEANPRCDVTVFRRPAEIIPSESPLHCGRAMLDAGFGGRRERRLQSLNG